MNRVVFLLDTGKPAVYRAAKWFSEHLDHVLLGVKGSPRIQIDGVEYLDISDISAVAEWIDCVYGKLDILVLGTINTPSDGEVGTGHDYEQFTETLTENVTVCREMIEALHPLLLKGLKRIACITEKESSVSWNEGGADLAYTASLAAVNMLGRMMFNKLRPEGFTFRWFSEGDEPCGMCAAEYITSALCYDPKEPYTHSDENRFVLRDGVLREYSW
ncbi:MAG: hypothetical protein J6C51_08090 [Clostridia bacterium]|nr:hypothetical protein [Clostridia bacterium]